MFGDRGSKVTAVYCSHQRQKVECTMRVGGLTPDEASRIAVLASGVCLVALVELHQVVLPEGSQLAGTCRQVAVTLLKPV